MDGNEFLFRGTTPAIKFPTIGSTVVGMITKVPKVTEVTDPATKEVKRWQNGQPKMQVIIDLQTELKENEDDDGTRTLWAKGQMQQAIRDAVLKANAKILEVGGILQVTYSGEKPTNLQPQKLYTATYWPPQKGVEVPPTPWEAQRPETPPTPAYVAPQVTMGARPVSPAPVQTTPPAPADGANLPMLERLRQMTANQQAHQAARSTNAQGDWQNDEPPF